MKGLPKDLSRWLDRNRVLTAPEDLLAYRCDACHDTAKGDPEAVVLPENAEEVAAVLRYANGSSAFRRYSPVWSSAFRLNLRRHRKDDDFSRL